MFLPVIHKYDHYVFPEIFGNWESFCSIPCLRKIPFYEKKYSQNVNSKRKDKQCFSPALSKED